MRAPLPDRALMLPDLLPDRPAAETEQALIELARAEPTAQIARPADGTA